jgi:hypothetical protein
MVEIVKLEKYGRMLSTSSFRLFLLYGVCEEHSIIFSHGDLVLCVAYSCRTFARPLISIGFIAHICGKKNSFPAINGRPTLAFNGRLPTKERPTTCTSLYGRPTAYEGTADVSVYERPTDCEGTADIYVFLCVRLSPLKMDELSQELFLLESYYNAEEARSVIAWWYALSLKDGFRSLEPAMRLLLSAGYNCRRVEYLPPPGHLSVILSHDDVWFIALAEDGWCSVRPLVYTENQAWAWEAFLLYYRVISPEVNPFPPDVPSPIVLNLLPPDVPSAIVLNPSPPDIPSAVKPNPSPPDVPISIKREDSSVL